MAGRIWLEEYHGNPSVVALCFTGPTDDQEVSVGLTKPGVEATIELLTEWLQYHDERMEELFSNLLTGLADE